MQAVDVNAEAARVLAAGPDPHDILALPRGAPLADVKARWKKLCALHPDKAHGNALAAEAFALINAAYHKLNEAGAAPAGPLHGSGSQPEAAPAVNRWQAFAGGRQQPVAPAQQQQQQQQQQRAQQPFPESQENTPGSSNADRGAGAWQASAKWGRFGGGGSSLLRAQPVAATPAAAPGPAEQPVAREQRPVRTEPQARRRSLSLSSAGGGTSDDSDSDGSSSSGGSDTGGQHSFQHTGGWRATGGVKPAAFYGPAGGSGSKQASPSLSQAPAASLMYGMFAGRRSSGGQASGWLGAGAVASSAPPEQRTFSQPAAVPQQPPAAVAGSSKWGSGGPAGQWGGSGRLADMLKTAPVTAAVRATSGLAAAAAGAAPPQQPAPQEGQEAQPGGAAQQQPKRRQPPTPLSSSASSGDDASWDDSGAIQGAGGSADAYCEQQDWPSEQVNLHLVALAFCINARPAFLCPSQTMKALPPRASLLPSQLKSC